MFGWNSQMSVGQGREGGGGVAIINSIDKDTVKPFATEIDVGLVYRDYINSGNLILTSEK
jgi:hypothetical protein